ncbi:M20/M25/M40 family metallo-hydrolase [Nitratifractor sp.]|uniref:M20/M25/M40 family metallo-hydrolase n=1 Tax=Nitratifractor sp. TaxID=2268144 RepID=UPI0025D32A59|nr:M20/M25/M40 family metallo-hydrolase [Nitratifractor sp.]
MQNGISRVFEHFEAISAIPHCSRQAKGLRDYLVNFARERGYEVSVDAAGNILVRRGSPKLCLQAHYDMVCVGKAPEIEIVEDEGWLEAIDSSLGADNGIAVAMMMALMDEGKELEFLWTADEEVGLLGAKALEMALQSGAMLNLDNEEEGVVMIGCAGGVDLIAERPCGLVSDERPLWRVSVSGLPGGHSGVDIDKGIPNALKILGQYLAEREVALVRLEGGERRNSIPVHAEALVRSSEALEDEAEVRVEQVEEGVETPKAVLAESEHLLRFLATAPHGVVEENTELAIPETSLNLARVEWGAQGCRIEYSLRAMSDPELEGLAERMETLLGRYGFTVRREEGYPAWKPRRGPFVEKIVALLEKEFPRVSVRAIHAGLECGVFAQKYPSLQMASIGPTIENPHSVRERVKIDSVKRTFDALERIVGDFMG